MFATLNAFMQRWLHSRANNAECCCLKVGRGEWGGGRGTECQGRDGHGAFAFPPA